MIDAIPEGYTTLPAAVTLLTATIAEVDVARTRPMRRLFDALGLLLPIPSNGNSDDIRWLGREQLGVARVGDSKLQSGPNTGELVFCPNSDPGSSPPSNPRIGEVLRSVTNHSQRRRSIVRVQTSKPRRKTGPDIGNRIERLLEGKTAPACRRKVRRLASGSDAVRQRIKPKREWGPEAISQSGEWSGFHQQAPALQESGATWDYTGRAP
jgi:hypothetical protein